MFNGLFLAFANKAVLQNAMCFTVEATVIKYWLQNVGRKIKEIVELRHISIKGGLGWLINSLLCFREWATCSCY